MPTWHYPPPLQLVHLLQSMSMKTEAQLAKVGRPELQSHAVILGVPHSYSRPKIARCISKLPAGQRQAM